MSIQAGNAPQAAFDAISRTLADPHNSFFLSGAFGPTASPRAFVLTVPHRVAYLPVEAIRPNSNLIEVVRLQHWRYLVMAEQQAASGAGIPAAIADVTSVEVESNKYEFGVWGEGSFVAGTEAAIREAEKDERIWKGDFEPFLLIVPAVDVTALWLRALGKRDNGRSDLIVPIPPLDSTLKPYEVIEAWNFLGKMQIVAEILRPVAQGA